MDEATILAVHEKFVGLIQHLPPAFQDVARQNFLSLVDHLNTSPENLAELFDLLGLVHFAGKASR